MILVGARQVGKTWIMKEFGKNEYAINDNLNMYINDHLRMYTSDYALI